jgi:hypothetical protein
MIISIVKVLEKLRRKKIISGHDCEKKMEKAEAVCLE